MPPINTRRFRKVLTQQPHGKISEYLYILRYLITNNSFKFCFWFRLGSWSKGKKRVLPIYILSWMMHRHYMFKFGIQMPLGTPVKGGLSFNHFSCIIINTRVRDKKSLVKVGNLVKNLYLYR